MWAHEHHFAANSVGLAEILLPCSSGHCSGPGMYWPVAAGEPGRAAAALALRQPPPRSAGATGLPSRPPAANGVGGPGAQPWAGQNNAASPAKGGDQGGVLAGAQPAPGVAHKADAAAPGAARAQAAARRRSSAPSARVTLLRCPGAHSGLQRAAEPSAAPSSRGRGLLASGARLGQVCNSIRQATPAVLLSKALGSGLRGAIRTMEGPCKSLCIDLAWGVPPFPNRLQGTPVHLRPPCPCNWDVRGDPQAMQSFYNHAARAESDDVDLETALAQAFELEEDVSGSKASCELLCRAGRPSAAAAAAPTLSTKYFVITPRFGARPAHFR